MLRASFVLLSGMVVSLTLVACAPAVASPTEPSAEEVQAQIATSVVLTVSAYETGQAALTSPTPLPSETATVTPTLVLPTLTPFVPSPTHYVPGGVPGPILADYACSVYKKSPADNTVFKPGKDFDVKFWLWNIGAKKWDKGADLFFDSGTNMLDPNITYELPEVLPGDVIGPFVFDAKSPNKAGTFTMTFKVQGGFCYPYIRIVVRK